MTRSRWVFLGWLALIAVAAPFSARLPQVVRGGADPIPSSETGAVIRAYEAAFGRGAYHRVPIVLTSDSIETGDVRFGSVAGDLAWALEGTPGVSRVTSYWNQGAAELLGKDGRSALLMATLDVGSFSEAEALTATLRDTIWARTALGFQAHLTGTTAVLHDLDSRSSRDLLEAERIGIPLTLAILLVVFRAPLAALLPVLLALIAITIANAWLWLLSHTLPVSVFALNTVSMIGLGVGVDYALFVLSRYRAARSLGKSTAESAGEAKREAAEAVIFSGAAVAVGFLALLLVDAPFLRAIALGGACVVAVSALAAVTLLPAALGRFGRSFEWPWRPAPVRAAATTAGLWARWAHAVMRRPWPALLAGGAVLVALAWPAASMRSWNVVAESLPLETESRRGYETLRRQFSAGWMGPTLILFEAPPGHTVWEPAATRALLATAARVEADPRVDAVIGFDDLAPVLEWMAAPPRSIEDLPPAARGPAREVVSREGRVAVLGALTRSDPASPEAAGLVRELRGEGFAEARRAGLSARIGGPAAGLVDFDDELFGALPRVLAAVLLVTFVVLLLVFRSVVIPLKAIVLNLLSVLAAYGFLVLVFQRGTFAAAIGLDPPGGLNSFVVLMLFTILFGLSMDYEVFLLSRVRAAWLRLGDTRAAVAAGLEESAGVITSAALVMISIFAAFGFTRLVPTREFGLGLAVAVLLDATVVRVVLVPAVMVLAGRANWWWPFGSRGADSRRQPPT